MEERFLNLRLNKNISMPNVPIGNYLIMLTLVITFALQFLFDGGSQYLNGLILNHWSLTSIFCYMWLHANFVHVISNLIALWIFGRYVCLLIGNANYPLAYLFTGIVSAVAHIIYDGRPAIGASGAVMGILGMYVVLCYGNFGRSGPYS